MTCEITQMRPTVRTLVPTINGGRGYQKQDAEIVDYHLWKLLTQRARFSLRGPRPTDLTPGQYCTALGPAFTFGRFAAKPYPELLGEALNLSALNLGMAGIGPSFYNNPRHSALIDLINRSRFVSILIFSGRSQANSRFKTLDHSQEQFILDDGQIVPGDFAYQQLLETASPQTITDVIAETRERYVTEFSKLLKKITVPKVLLWVAKRQPDYQESYGSVYELLSSFPHLINQEMVDVLRPLCDAYVEYCDRPGLPQPLISRFTGKPTSVTRHRDFRQGKIQLTQSHLTHNYYYPSPEMHQEIAKRLKVVCERLVSG